VVILSCIAAVGCSVSDSATTTSLRGVDFATYQAAFLNFKDCMVTAGHPLQSVQLDEATQLYTYTMEPGVGDDCYSKAFEKVDAAWQLNDARPKPGYQRLSGREIFAECLTKRGEKVTANETANDLIAILPKYRLTIQDCVVEARKNHP
jgi:hypothetical protein